MDTLAAFRHLMRQRALMEALEQSKLPEWDRLLALGVALREAGFPCQAMRQDMRILAPGHSRLLTTMSALRLPLENGQVGYVGVDGTEGEDALIKRQIKKEQTSHLVPEYVFESGSDWHIPPLVGMDTFRHNQPNTHRGVACMRLLDIATSALQAISLNQATAPVDRAPLRSRI